MPSASSGAGGLEAYLARHDRHAWSEAVDALALSIHEVDRNATWIWFGFHPLELARAVEAADDPAGLERALWLQGRYRLADRIDSSHRFLYGHRHWAAVKQAVEDLGEASPAAALAQLVTETAEGVADEVGADVSLLLGITAVAFMTVRQVGLAAFREAPGAVAPAVAASRRSPDQVLAARARDDRQGLLGFLKGDRKTWTVTFDELDPAARFPAINSQELTTAAAADRRDYRSRDSRCHEGPIPVQCRSAFCGTCWIGVLGGAEKLSPVADLERRRIREFGYVYTDEPRPIIRLACQAQAFGAVSIVIPAWNGIVGRKLYGDEARASSEDQP